MRRVLAIAALVLLIAAMVTPTASAARGGIDRPVKGTFSGLVTFEYDWDDATCPVTTLTDTWGALSHLGWVTAHWSHCPPVAVPGYRNGHVEFTAANGDRLFGSYEDADEDSPFTIDIAGGTGRFAHAFGTFAWTFVASGEWGEDGLPIQPWTMQATLRGTLTY